MIFTQQHRKAWQTQVASDSSQNSDKVTASLLAAQWPAGHKLEYTGQTVGHRDSSRHNRTGIQLARARAPCKQVAQAWDNLPGEGTGSTSSTATKPVLCRPWTPEALQGLSSCPKPPFPRAAPYQCAFWAKQLQEIADELSGLLFPLLNEINTLLLHFLDKFL